MAEEMTEEQIAAERRLNEQCFMMANIDTFEKWGQDVQYPTMVKAKGGTPKQFIGKLVARKNLQDISKLKPHAISKLVPYIKIYKVFYPSEKGEGQEYEMKFENHLMERTVESIMTTRKGRGAGVGLKSFQWKLAGGNPVEADRMLEAKMVLFFESMDDILRKVKASPVGGEGSDRDISYIDLIHQSSKFNSEKCTGDRTYNNKYFRIKAVVGWSAPSDADPDVAHAAGVMESASATLFLTMTKHDISFDDSGGVTLTIDYMAAPEGIMNSPSADILSVNDETSARREQLQDQQETLKSQSAQACSGGKQRDKDAQSQTDKEISAVEELIALNNAERYKEFLTKLEDSNAIYSIEVDNKEIDSYTDSYFFGLIDGDLDKREDAIKKRLQKMRDYQSSSASWKSSKTTAPKGTLSDVKSSADEAASKGGDSKADAREDLSESATSESQGVFKSLFNGALNWLDGGNRMTDPDKVRINFLFLGGVLEIAFGAVRKDEALAEIRNIVGPFEYKDPLTGDKKNICLADVPISLNLFKLWYFDNCISPQRDTWTLREFVKDIVSNLVSPALGEDCFGACLSGYKTRCNTRVLQIPLDDDKKCRITGAKTVEATGGNKTKLFGDFKILPYPTGANSKGFYSGSYFMVYTSGASTNQGPPPAGESREERDAKNGIYHFTIGSDRGIVKKINFKREDAPHMTAARIQADGPGRLALRGLYNADVDMVGNSVFVPGQMVFIDPGSFTTSGDSGVQGSAANILGIGGYYLVITVDNVIESGKFESQLTCRWQSYGEGKPSGTDKYCQPKTEGDCEDNCSEPDDTPATNANTVPGAELPAGLGG